ncbi:hypothetical protein L5515_010170 [Caenorhabditis briggsae]|uniref:GATA-type domain-containing protein n=1 Tax=Caenorhabditis briggsae TaxID=6238 RepID=A0AAE9EQ53_CAEBR|nr:hypothetical protein L5515_010170 [Caenorhabditis briggsae]
MILKSHEAKMNDTEYTERSDKEIRQNEAKPEIKSSIDGPQAQYPILQMMPAMMFVGTNAVTLPNPIANLQMDLMNQIKIDLMSLAMSSPLFWNFPDLAATQNMEQQYPTPIWTPHDTVPINQEASEEKEEDVKENEAPQFTNFPANTRSMCQLDQNEPTPSKSESKQCSNCSITKSCQWRNVTSSEGILCNACFVYERKYKKSRPMKAIQHYKKRTNDFPSSPATKLAQGPSTPCKTPATRLAMESLSSFPATQFASATSTPKRRAMDPLSLLASPTPATQSYTEVLPTSATQLVHDPATSTPKRRAMDPLSLLASPTPGTVAQAPTTPRMSRPSPASQLAMEASPTPSKLVQDPTTPVAPNSATPKRSYRRKLLEESQKCSNCSIINSCRWRNVKSKESILCNACFVYRRYIKKDRPTSAIESYKSRINEM